MKRFVEGTNRGQSTLFPESLEDWIGEDNAVRVIDVFVDELDLGELGFSGVDPEATGRPSFACFRPIVRQSDHIADHFPHVGERPSSSGPKIAAKPPKASTQAKAAA